MRRIFTSLMLLLFCAGLCSPSHAFAKTNTRQRVEEASQRAWITTTYDAADFPADVLLALQENGLSDYLPENGVTLSTRFDSRPELQKDEWDRAVCVLVKDNVRWLAVLHSRKREAWTLELLCDHAILQNRAYSLDSVEDEGTPLGQTFRFTYPCADGSTEIYRLTWGFSDASLWHVDSYDHVDTAGKGVRIVCDYSQGYGYAVSTLPQTGRYLDTDKTFYPCYLPVYFNWASIEDYPTTQAQARQYSESSLSFFPDGYAMVWGEVNLREAASSQSPSLGRYFAGTLAKVLSASSGKDAPWYELQIGSVHGFVSGVYISEPQDKSFSEQLWHGPLPVAKTVTECDFHSAMDGNISQLPAGTEMRVLGYTDSGTLHVIISQMAVVWQMDLNGTDGYVSKNDVKMRIQP